MLENDNLNTEDAENNEGEDKDAKNKNSDDAVNKNNSKSDTVNSQSSEKQNQELQAMEPINTTFTYVDEEKVKSANLDSDSDYKMFSLLGRLFCLISVSITTIVALILVIVFAIWGSVYLEDHLKATDNLMGGLFIAGAVIMAIVMVISAITIYFGVDLCRGSKKFYWPVVIISIVLGGILGIIGSIFLLIDNKTVNYWTEQYKSKLI